MNNIHGLGGGPAGRPARGPSGGPSGGDGSPDCKTQMKQYWSQIPLFNRFVLVTCLSIYLISFIFPMIISVTILLPVQIMTLQSKFLSDFG